MNIHIIVYNENKITNINLNSEKFGYNILFWNYDKIIVFINENYPKYTYFYKKLLLNKSKENFVKYLIISKYGGIFINVNLFITLNQTHTNLINDKILQNDDDIIFWEEKIQKNITLDIFDINESILNDDIFIVKKPNNNFIDWLITQYDINSIPINEFENKIKFGNIFLSQKLHEFITNYSSNNNFDKNNWFSNFFKGKQKNNIIEFENNIFSIELNDNFQFNESYKLITYPNVPELLNPEKILNSWDAYYHIKNYIENFIIYTIFQYRNWFHIIIVIILITCINYLLKKYISNSLNIVIKPYQFDSKVIFNPKKFKIFREIYKNWKIIQKEVIEIISNAPKLDISKNINNYDKYGWIKTFNNNYDENNKNQILDCNNSWLNYRLIYYNKEFNENIKYCPKTIETLRKINSNIIRCGFSLMHGNCLLQSNKDNIEFTCANSLKFYLYLIVPKPDNSCKFIIKNENNEFVQFLESTGKIIIFDPTMEHYTYNQSNSDKVILYIDYKVE